RRERNFKIALMRHCESTPKRIIIHEVRDDSAAPHPHTCSRRFLSIHGDGRSIMRFDRYLECYGATFDNPIYCDRDHRMSVGSCGCGSIKIHRLAERTGSANPTGWRTGWPSQ